MQLRNTAKRYGLIAITFHWVMAILVIGLIGIGWYMARMPISLQKLKFYGWHKEYGILVLFLVVLRFTWRMGSKIPPMPTHLAAWQRFSAHMAHFILYLLLVAMPLTGWMKSSAAGLPVSFFGLFVLPDIVPVNKTLLAVFTQTHAWLGYVLIAVIVAHAVAALQHHFYYKDDILRRMLP